MCSHAAAKIARLELANINAVHTFAKGHAIPCDSPGHWEDAHRAVDAMTYPAGTISGHKFDIGVLKLALAKGLNLQAHTPATNGYTAALWQEFQEVIVVPLRGHITAH